MKAQAGSGVATDIATVRRTNRSPRATRSLLQARALSPGAHAAPLRIAILDRDSGFLLVLAKRLQRPDWQHRILSPRTSTKALAAAEVDVLIVDLALLAARRWTWLSDICSLRPDLSVVVCTGPSTVAERVRGLRLGAADWLSKPCHPEELIARLEAVTCDRRRPEARDIEPVTFGEVEIRPAHYQAFVAGRSLRLTRREYQLMELLSRAEEEVLPRESIYESLWGYEMARNDRSVDVFVHKLRRKLERASPGWRYIHTGFGVGYRLAAESAGGGASAHPLEPVAETSLAA
jgi:DNA-binding response OmpR family regulator